MYSIMLKGTLCNGGAPCPAPERITNPQGGVVVYSFVYRLLLIEVTLAGAVFRPVAY